jgi:hypothetical protein
MKFDRKKLLESLTTVAPALSANSSIVQFKHVWFEGDKVYAYNGGMGIKTNLKTGLKLAVLGSPLIGFLSSEGSEQALLEERNGTLEIKLGKATASLPTMGLDSAPWSFPAKPDIKAELVLDDVYKKALKRACLVQAAKPNRVEHYGVIVFALSSPELLLYSTDSKTIVELPVKTKQKLPKSVDRTVLPFEFLDVLLDLKGDVSLSICADCFAAKTESVLVCCNMLDSSGVADLPELAEKHTKQKQTMVEVPSALSSALARAEILASSGDAYLTLEINGSELTLDGKLELGHFRETIALAKSAPSAKIGVDGRLLKKALGEVKRFAITTSSLIGEGADEFLFIQAAYG